MLGTSFKKEIYLNLLSLRGSAMDTAPQNRFQCLTRGLFALWDGENTQALLIMATKQE